MNVTPLPNLISTPIIKVRSCNTELATENSTEYSGGTNRQMTFANQGNDYDPSKKWLPTSGLSRYWTLVRVTILSRW